MDSKKPNANQQADNSAQDPVEGEALDPKQQAIKYKTFRHIFTQKDIKRGIDDKTIQRKLKKSKELEDSYQKFVKVKEKDPDAREMVFPWDSFRRRFVFWFTYWGPRMLLWSSIAFFALFCINYIPGPTQHIVELIFARAIYDTAPIKRLPASLETYAHSASILDSQGAIIKSYGKREVTKQIPEKAKKAVLACEDHYFLPHPKNPWYVNTFLIHHGVSWFNLVGALVDTLSGNKRGASTIVMQNSKKILGNTDRTIANKIEEIIVSYMMVSRFGKEQNLDFYINTVPVGSNIYGFPAAAKNYFKKPLKDLNIQQLVTVASFIPNHNRQRAFYKIVNGKNFDELTPSQLNHARGAINKVNLALGFLRDRGEITADDFLNWKLSNEESIRRIGLRNYRSPLYGEEEWTSWNVVKEVTSRGYMVNGRKITGAELLLDERGDVVIETGVDLVLAEKIKEIIADFLNDKKYRNILARRNRNMWQDDLERYEKMGIEPPYTDFDGFMEYLFRHINIGVMMINQKGQIISYVGGKEFLQKSGDDAQNDPELNDAEEEETEESSSNQGVIIDLMNKKATVTPSSTIKPIIAYYTMVATDATLETTFQDKPLEYKYVEEYGKEIWLPRNWYNYDKMGTGHNRYLGRKYSLLEAQVLSVNTIFARLYSNRKIQNAMLIGFDEIDLDYNREDARYWPFGIGASDVPVQQWLGVYNAFLDGYYREPSFVKRITINNETIYERQTDEQLEPVMLFDAKKERETEMHALYEVCNRGTGASMRTEFKFHKNLVSGKTGTAPKNRSSLFVSHFNPYQNRSSHPEKNMTMIVAFTTNTGGYKSVGTSDQGPTKVAGSIYDYIFHSELNTMMDQKLAAAKRENSHFRNNHLYWANVNRYMEQLLQGKCGKHYIYENIIGVDGYDEALEQILNSDNRIYAGNDELFGKLVDYYCDQSKVVRLKDSETDN